MGDSSYVPLEGPFHESTPQSQIHPEFGFPLTDRSKESCDAWRCWDDQVLHRYSTKHRQRDMEIIRSNWPVAASGSSVFVADTPKKVQKRCLRVLATHGQHWLQKHNEINNLFDSEGCKINSQRIIKGSTELLKAIQQTLPKVDGLSLRDTSDSAKTIEPPCECCVSFTYLQFYCFYRRMGIKYDLGDFVGGIQDADSAMQLFSPLSASRPIPYPSEVIPMFYRARSKEALGNREGALLDYRCCAAVMRLVMSQKDTYPEVLIQSLIKECRGVVPRIVRLLVLEKVKKGAPRPFFSTEELFRYESELGLGPYSRNAYKCNRCGDSSKKLLYCARCRRVPYCCPECNRLDWKIHKRSCGENWRKQPIVLNWLHYHNSICYVEQGDGVCLLISNAEASVAVQCLDPDTFELFDGWTDRPYISDWDVGLE